MKKDAGYLYRNIRICSAHFEDEMFTKSQKNPLIPGAFPTLFDVPNPPPRIGVKRKLLEREDTEYTTSKHTLYCKKNIPAIS